MKGPGVHYENWLKKKKKKKKESTFYPDFRKRIGPQDVHLVEKQRCFFIEVVQIIKIKIENKDNKDRILPFFLIKIGNRTELLYYYFVT